VAGTEDCGAVAFEGQVIFVLVEPESVQGK
jgi:hypothetical protein